MMTDISSLSLEGTDADELSEFYLKCVTILNKSKGSDQAAQNQASTFLEGQLVDVSRASGDPILRWAAEKYKEKWEEYEQDPARMKPKELCPEWLIKKVEELMKEKNTEVQKIRDDVGRRTGQDIWTGGTYKCMVARAEDVLASREGDPWLSESAKMKQMLDDNSRKQKKEKQQG